MSQTNPTEKEATDYASHYILNGVMVDAWFNAYPYSKMGRNNAMVKAHHLHKSVKIQTRLAELKVTAKKQLETKFEISVEHIQKHLAAVLTAGIKYKKDQQGNQVPVNLSAVVSASAEINKMNGNYDQSEKEIVGDLTVRIVRAKREN